VSSACAFGRAVVACRPRGRRVRPGGHHGAGKVLESSGSFDSADFDTRRAARNPSAPISAAEATGSPAKRPSREQGACSRERKGRRQRGGGAGEGLRGMCLLGRVADPRGRGRALRGVRRAAAPFGLGTASPLAPRGARRRSSSRRSAAVTLIRQTCSSVSSVPG